MKIDLETLELNHVGPNAEEPTECGCDDVISKDELKKLEGFISPELDWVNVGDEVVVDLFGEKHLGVVNWTDYDFNLMSVSGKTGAVVCSMNYVVALKKHNRHDILGIVDVMPGDLVMTRDGRRGVVVVCDPERGNLIVACGGGWSLSHFRYADILFSAHHSFNGGFDEGHYVSVDDSDAFYTNEEYEEVCEKIAAAYREDNA